jgi:hypothetical protein
MAEATRVREALDSALRQSADQLLAAAIPKADQVADAIERELNEGTDAVRARIADLRDAISKLGDLYGQAAWTRAVVHAEGRSVSPYRGSGGFTETLGKLRVVEDALAFELDNLAERRRQAEAERARPAGEAPGP